MGQAAEDMYDDAMKWREEGQWCEKHKVWYLPESPCPECEDGEEFWRHQSEEEG